MKASRSIRYVFQAAVVLSWVVATCTPALGALIPGYPDDVYQGDTRELARLPKYCMYTQLFRDSVPGGKNYTEIARWTEIMGGHTFNAMHHYCAGLIKANRANFLTKNPQVRSHYLNDSVDEFEYVIRDAPPDFVLLPEILTKKGESLIRVGRAAQALTELQRAIELKSDYWPPYTVVSDYYKDKGDLAKAREWLEKGLSFSPNTKALQNRLAEIDESKGKRKTTAPSTGGPAALGPPATKSVPQLERPAADPQAPAGR